MNSQYVNEFIANSPFLEWFNNQTIEYVIPEWEINLPFKGVSAFHIFLEQQQQGWNELEKEIPPEFINVRDIIGIYRNLVENLFNPDYSQTQLDRIWLQAKSHIENSNINNKPILFNIPITKFLIELNKINHELFVGGYYYYTSTLANAQNNKNILKGYLLAYEFDTKSYSELASRKEINEDVINIWNKKTSEYFNASESYLSNYINSTKNTFDKVNQQILDEKEQNSKEYSEWFAKVSQEQFDFNKENTNKITELATAYEEKLRLEMPIKYWAERAIQLKSEAKLAIYWLIGIIGFASFSLYLLLWLTREGLLENIFGGDKTKAIRWSIVFIIFLSFLFFGVRTLMKVAFSSLHLARDAEEREKLTYVYLAMIKNSSVDKDDRALILQSLFSRADTGLLKDDGGPTMPGGILEKIK